MMRPSLLEHVVDDLLGDVEQAVEVGLDDLVPLLVGHLAEHAVARDSALLISTSAGRARRTFSKAARVESQFETLPSDAYTS